MFTGYEIWKGKKVEYVPDPEVPRLQRENAVLKDSVISLKCEVRELDSSYRAKSNLYVITKRYYDELKKKYGAANSDANNALLEQFLRGTE